MDSQPAKHRGRKFIGLVALGVVVLLAATTYIVRAVGTNPGVYLPFVFQDYKTCGTAPTLASPSNGATIDSLVPQFQGDAGQDAAGRYVFIQVALDPDFKQIVKTVSARTSHGPFSAEIMGNLEPGMPYAWRAQLVCTSQVGPFSEARSFITPVSGTLPDSPELFGPPSEGKDVTRPVEFTWEAVPGASSYLVYYKASGPYGWYILKVPQARLTRSMSPSSTYEWYVVPRNNYGFGPESAHQTFTTAP